jgi:phage N-6-adenine-methyltransferase
MQERCKGDEMSNPRIPFNESYYSARSDNGEWYTPPDITERVRRALGGTIDLDPFSCDVAQENVQATHYFTRERDAMLYDWPVGHTLFANPPYGRGIIGKCVTKIVREFPHSWHTGIILVNNATDTGWFHQLARMSSAACIFQQRIQFIQPQDVTVDRNTRGQIALYIGNDPDLFTSSFYDVGLIAYF